MKDRPDGEDRLWNLSCLLLIRAQDTLVTTQPPPPESHFRVWCKREVSNLSRTQQTSSGLPITSFSSSQATRGAQSSLRPLSQKFIFLSTPFLPCITFYSSSHHFTVTGNFHLWLLRLMRPWIQKPSKWGSHSPLWALTWTTSPSSHLRDPARNHPVTPASPAAHLHSDLCHWVTWYLTLATSTTCGRTGDTTSFFWNFIPQPNLPGFGIQSFYHWLTPVLPHHTTKIG